MPTFNSIGSKAYNTKVDAGRFEQEQRARIHSTMDPGVAELLEMIFRYTGQGSLINQTQLFFCGFDRFGTNTVPLNVEQSGLTFFTRPKLPLTSGNLQLCPPLIGLDTVDERTYAFAIRCWLDTKFSRNGSVAGKVLSCPFFNFHSGINIPLSNACVAQSGWPDPFIQTYTTTGGFFSEDQTFPIGSDRLRKTYDLQFTFKELQGGPILAMLYAWYEVMACLTEGSMVAYSEDIDAQRMCYTCSIYRFLLDPSHTHITHYAKATGCFPKAPPMGALFNQSRGENFVSAASEISIPFVANKVEYDDPRILMDFNMLITRYCNDIHTYPILRPESYNNFKGIPFVITSPYGLELTFREPYDQPVKDYNTKRILPTTREMYELSSEFFKNMPESDRLKLPRGQETRFLYRVTAKGDKDQNGKDLPVGQLYLSADDEYKVGDTKQGSGGSSSGATLPSQDKGKAMDTTKTYQGVPLSEPLRDIIRLPDGFNLGQITDENGDPVTQFSPVLTKNGALDNAAIKRAINSDKSNRDNPDAGTNP